jgi:hypothetical protein
MKNFNKLKWWHVAIIICSVIIGICYTAIKSPEWDEMCYVDPGAQLALQGRMVSAVWTTNSSPNELWASSNPGIPLLLAGWFKVFGFGIIQSRILFYILHFSGVIAFFFWIRNKFNPSALALVLGISGSFILPSLAEPIVSFRLEVLAFLFFTLFLYYTWTDQESVFLNWIAPTLLGFLTVLFGFHFTTFFVLAAGIAILLKRDKTTVLRAVALATGIVLGMIILWAVYKQLGMWDTFMASRLSHIGKQLRWCPTGFKKLTILKDWWVFIALAVIGFFGNFRQNRSQWLPWVLAIAAFFTIPYIISSIGIYYRAYIWMVSLPMILCFYYSENSLKGWYLNFSIILLTFSLVNSGLYKIRYTRALYKINQYQNQVLKIVNDRFPGRTSIIGNVHMYYHLTSHGYKFYPHRDPSEGNDLGHKQDYYFPKNLRDQVQCIVIITKDMERFPKFLDRDGKWIQLEKLPSPPIKGDPWIEINVFVREQ